MGISTVLPIEEIPSITVIYMIGVASLPAENAKTVLICIIRFFPMANLVEVAVHRKPLILSAWCVPHEIF